MFTQTDLKLIRCVTQIDFDCVLLLLFNFIAALLCLFVFVAFLAAFLI